MKFTYLKTPLNKYTFKSKKIKTWVESNIEGRVLNLFAGITLLDCDEVRNDMNPDMIADYHFDALEFCRNWEGSPFDSILLDPPYAFRKCMTKYKGFITSPFNLLKDEILNILTPHGLVITLGYHSVSMGKKRGFKQEHLLVMSHGGAIHDTLAIKERRI